MQMITVHIKGNVDTVYEENGNYYFNKRVSLNQYFKCYVPVESVTTLHRNYAKSKSFPLTRTVTTISHPTNNPITPYVAVLYQTLNFIFENARVLPRGNTGERNSKRFYFRTSREILDKVKKRVKLGKAPKKNL